MMIWLLSSLISNSLFFRVVPVPGYSYQPLPIVKANNHYFKPQRVLLTTSKLIDDPLPELKKKQKQTTAADSLPKVFLGLNARRHPRVKTTG